MDIKLKLHSLNGNEMIVTIHGERRKPSHFVSITDARMQSTQFRKSNSVILIFVNNECDVQCALINTHTHTQSILNIRLNLYTCGFSKCKSCPKWSMGLNDDDDDRIYFLRIRYLVFILSQCQLRGAHQYIYL